MKHRAIQALLMASCATPIAAQADTICSKQLLRNSYGFAGTASGYSDVPLGAPVTCGFGGVLVFDANDGVTVKKLTETCAKTTSPALVVAANPPATDPTVGTYTLDAATCTADILLSTDSGYAQLKVMFTDNGQRMHFTLQRGGYQNGPVTGTQVAGSGTGARL